MSKKHIPIFFATDDNYLPYLAVTLASIEAHASDDYLYDIKILTTGLSDENVKTLKSLDVPHLSVNIVNLEERVGKIRKELRLRLRDYYSETIYYRIFIPSLFPRLERAIYLDCDVVLRDDIANMYFTDIGDNILGAISDESIAPIPEFCEYVDKVIGSPEGIYFNSGVLLINAKRFREEKVEEKLLALLTEYNFHTVAPDQDYLNYICRGKVHYLAPTWNKQPAPKEGISDSDLHLIHYNMFNKPWHYQGVLYEEYFWLYAKKTPFYERILHELESYTDEKKLADSDGARKLIAATADILNERCSFCHVIGKNHFDEVKL